MDEHTDTLTQESFEENIRLFAQPGQRPEQYNRGLGSNLNNTLYNGG